MLQSPHESYFSFCFFSIKEVPNVTQNFPGPENRLARGDKGEITRRRLTSNAPMIAVWTADEFEDDGGLLFASP
jgi:hypothetical protein